MRDMHLFSIEDNENSKYIEVSAIHNEEGYQRLRSKLSAQYNLSNNEPNIQVFNVDKKGDRSLTLRYVAHKDIPLDNKSAQEVMKHLHRLWSFDVRLEQVLANGETEVISQSSNQKS